MKYIFKKRNFFGFLSVLFLCIFIIKSLKPEFSLMYDSRTKALQIHSLINSGFHSEELPYLAKEIDSKGEYFPMPESNRTKLGESTIAVFPIALAALASPIYYFFGVSGLPYFNLLGLFFFLWVLRKYWRASNWFLVLSLFGSYLLVLLIEYSEHTLFLGIVLSGITLFYKRHWHYAGIVLGLSIWFRHEGIIFSACFLFASWISEGFPILNRKKKLLDSITFKMGIGFLFVFATFLFFNWIRYASFLGPRFHVNYGDSGIELGRRLEWAMGFLLLNKTEDNTLRIGFFAYIPLALFTFGILLSNLKRISLRKRVIVISSALFLLIIPFIAPNHGFWEWGPRYLSAGIPPAILTGLWFWNYLSRKKNLIVYKIGYAILIAVPILLTIIGLQLANQSRKETSKMYRTFRELGADTYVFHDFTAMYFIGNDYLSKMILCVPKETSLNDLIRLLSEKQKDKKIALIQIKKELISPEQLEKTRKSPVFDPMLKIGPWDEKSVSAHISKFYRNAHKVDSKYFDIWLLSPQAPTM